MGVFGANYGANYNLLADTTDPTVSIVSPIDTAEVTLPFTVSGTAADNIGLSKVEVQVDAEAFQLATGTTNWSISLSGLSAGSHTITAKATDTSNNTATDAITITVLIQGGASGGRVKKKVGHQLTDLGPRPHITVTGESHSILVLRPLNTSKAKLVIKVQAESKCVVIPHFGGVSTSKLILPVKAKSISKLYYKSKGESWAVTHPSILMEKVLKRTHGTAKAIKALSYLNMLDSIDEMYKSRVMGFSFNEKASNEQLIAFTHSSSFIGNVQYNTETGEMKIIINGKQYSFCGVPARVYDGFEGAGSKGNYFGLQIRGKYDC